MRLSGLSARPTGSVRAGRAIVLALLVGWLAGCGKRDPAPATPQTANSVATAVPSASNECPAQFVGEQSTLVRFATPTRAGMHALWKPSAFVQICGVKDWEKRFNSDADIEKSIAEGSFVPLNVHADGAASIELRIGKAAAPAAITTQESLWRKASSEPYLFHSDGLVNAGGIEHVGGRQAAGIRSVALPKGHWSVHVHYLEAPASERKADPLYPPDFLVLLNPVSGAHAARFRRSVDTFAVTMR